VFCTDLRSRFQWPRGLRRRSAAARLLRLWVRIPPEAWMFVCCECRVLPVKGLCDELITRPEESYWLWCVVVCDLETSWMRRPWPTGGCCAIKKEERRRTDLRNKASLFPYTELTGLLLDAFAKLRKATITCVMSVRLSVRPHRTKLGSHWTDFNKIWYTRIFFFENLSRKFRFH